MHGMFQKFLYQVLWMVMATDQAKKQKQQKLSLPILCVLSELSWEMLTILPQQYSATELSKVIFYTN